MRAGTLRQSIVVQKPILTRDAYGATVRTWETSVALRARKAITGGREYMAAQQRFAELSVLFVTRYSDLVGPEMRVEHNGDYYEILSVYDPVGTGRELQIACKGVK